jgi:hypothetical protein
LTISEG